MKQVREIINEAAIRVNLATRTRNVQGDILENGFKLLQGIISKYNEDNLLNWTQNSIITENSEYIHIYDNSDILKGKNNLYFKSMQEMDDYELTGEDYDNHVEACVDNKIFEVKAGVTPGAGVTFYFSQKFDTNSQREQQMLLYANMLHVQIRDVAKINSIYLISQSNTPYTEHAELKFINHTDFDRFSISSRCFTYTPKSQGEWLVQLKPLAATKQYRLKINYNEAISFDEGIDTDLYIPDNYVELLIVALAHKLAIMYPRIDDAQMERLEKEVKVMVDSVRTPRAEDRILLRDQYFESTGTMTQQELLSGIWFC